MKNEKIKRTFFPISEKSNTQIFCSEKVRFFKNLITNTILSIQRYKIMDIISASDVNMSIRNLESLYSELNRLEWQLGELQDMDLEHHLTHLQQINNELSAVFRTYGTTNLADLVTVAMGTDFQENLMEEDIYKVLRSFTHPIGYKVLPWKDKPIIKEKKNLPKNRIVEDYMIVETSKNFDCFDLARTSRNFQKKVYGIKIALHNPAEKKTLIILGLVDDILVECTSHAYLRKKVALLLDSRPKDPLFQTQDFIRFSSSLTVKELLVYSSKELYHRFLGYLNQIKLIKEKSISQNVKEFINSELYGQRRTLIQLLMRKDDPEYHYLAYLLYDLLSNDSNGSVDTVEQTILFDSLPWNTKKYFREAMKTTIDYTKSLTNFDNSQIPIEQQICLLKAPDAVKEKAMLKLKEVKAKSEDSGSKARQYLDGLLRIPFGIYRQEEILTIRDRLHARFVTLVKLCGMAATTAHGIPSRPFYTSLEIPRYLKQIEGHIVPETKDTAVEALVTAFTCGKRDNLIANCCYINRIIKKLNIKKIHICHSGKKRGAMQVSIRNFILQYADNIGLMKELHKRYPGSANVEIYHELQQGIDGIRGDMETIASEITQIRACLDQSIYGHKNAKRQLERIIGQWISGSQDGYCFGFEGPPGVGKTSLAKNGLAHCLRSKGGVDRPFAFIALGGSSNGSTLCGHNYTYVGSTWGRILDILMEKKCMNPIIFIDELDKVSRSERGKEIIGILTHLVDSTQNSAFHDNYFSGIDLNLSRALFIFSYNDPSTIDRVLLDRIHRIRFETLSLKEKLVIAREYILPEIYKGMNLQGCLSISTETLEFIIITYTNEAGVRKLKEILFEIISEVNLEILQNNLEEVAIPYAIDRDAVANHYLVERHEIIHPKVHKSPSIGVTTGLWANSLGRGGVLAIECTYSLAPHPLDFKLTGMQGDVMKESMNVAKTLAWKLTPAAVQKEILATFKTGGNRGLHIHCPEGATPKDGPSAGTAVTVAIYSLLTGKPVKNTVAITGEIDLQGRVTRIGGLPLKLLGGIRAGVKEFVFPQENMKDYTKFRKKHHDMVESPDIQYHPVTTIEQVLELVF